MATVAAKPGTRRKFDSLEQEAYLAMWRTYDRLRAVEDEFFDDWDLTAQQYNVLRLLQAAHPEPLPTLRLVGKLVSRAPDVTRMIDKLEAAGWIARTRSESDRRAVLVGITPAGQERLNEMADPLADCHERQLGHMSASDLKALTVLLRAARLPHEPPDSPWR